MESFAVFVSAMAVIGLLKSPSQEEIPISCRCEIGFYVIRPALGCNGAMPYENILYVWFKNRYTK
jgi:hypothetical protein